jgi:hypothetical protein
MARADVRGRQDFQEIGAAIVAAWFKALPEQPGAPVAPIDSDEIRDELQTVFARVLATNVKIIFDPADGSFINIVVPRPPVETRSELIEYLSNFHQASQGQHYHEELGTAVVFGCGR